MLTLTKIGHPAGTRQIPNRHREAADRKPPEKLTVSHAAGKKPMDSEA